MADGHGTLGPRTRLFLLLRTGLFAAFVLPTLMLLAGRLDYWQGWAYGGVNLLILGANALISRANPGLAAERTKPGGPMKGWDRVFFAVSSPLGFAAVILSTLDAGRLGWSPPLPAWGYPPAYAAFLAGQALFLWAHRANAFFSTVVRIQTERGHRVCDRGPYRLVRHPGYLGWILSMLATPLVLGSLWGLLPQAAAAAALLARTRLEDRALREELDGYREYCERVRWRLLPRLW